jgi:hypothetical protein
MKSVIRGPRGNNIVYGLICHFNGVPCLKLVDGMLSNNWNCSPPPVA